MGTYKGNVGNLMQHWTLCEILKVANKYVCGLNYIDAHAMAPWATTRTARNINEFDSVRNSLWNCPPGQNSVLERAWNSLAWQQKLEGYPNSAAFVRQVWNAPYPYSMLLCENNRCTAGEIKGWLQVVRQQDADCVRAEIFPGDWRERLGIRLPSPSRIGLPEDSLTLVSFDPFIYSQNSSKSRKSTYLYRPDLGLVLYALSNVDGPVIVQLSTYSDNGGNSHEKVISSVNSLLRRNGFTPAPTVRVNEPNRRMMSLVYARKVNWAADLAGLAGNFTNWLGEVKRRMREQVR